jgi:heme/copper-type cytochrome/quinol oxidase subunit 3
MHSWTVSDVLSLLLIVLFVIAFVLVMSVVTRKECDIEADRSNTIRAQLLTLLAIALGTVVLVSQRYQLQHAVQHLME